MVTLVMVVAVANRGDGGAGGKEGGAAAVVTVLVTEIMMEIDVEAEAVEEF